MKTPVIIAWPIQWRAEHGWFFSRYWIRWTDGSYQPCSRRTIEAYGVVV